MGSQLVNPLLTSFYASRIQALCFDATNSLDANFQAPVTRFDVTNAWKMTRELNPCETNINSIARGNNKSLGAETTFIMDPP